jgi:hypothetical protein
MSQTPGLDAMSSPPVSSRLTTIQRRMLAGLCRDCGDVPPIPGIARCKACREAQAIRVREYRERKRKTGHRLAWVREDGATPLDVAFKF